MSSTLALTALSARAPLADVIMPPPPSPYSQRRERRGKRPPSLSLPPLLGQALFPAEASSSIIFSSRLAERRCGGRTQSCDGKEGFNIE